MVKFIFKMNVANDWNNMNKKSLIMRIVSSTYSGCTWNAIFTTTCDNKFALIHFSKVNSCLISPELM